MPPFLFNLLITYEEMMNKLLMVSSLLAILSGCVSNNMKDDDCGLYDFECKPPQEALIDMQKIRQEIADTRTQIQRQEEVNRDSDSVRELTKLLQSMQDRLERMEQHLEKIEKQRSAKSY